LSLSSPIQKLLLQGSSAPLKIDIKGLLNSDEVEKLHGEVSSKTLSGQGWSVAEAEGIIHQSQANDFELELSARQFSWDSNFAYRDLIGESKESLGLSNITSSEIVGIKLKAKLDEAGGEVSKASAKYEKVKLSFEGGWERGGRLKGKFKTNLGKSSAVLF